MVETGRVRERGTEGESEKDLEKERETERNRGREREILGDPKVTENIYCKTCNLSNTDTQNHSTDLR